MQTLMNHIDRVREKPHQVRRQVAISTAFAITTVIAIAWLGISLSTGVFAIQGSTFADSTGNIEMTGPNAGLAGAAAAVPTDRDEPKIEIIDARTAPASSPEETIIPF